VLIKGEKAMPGFERVEFRSEGYKLIGNLHCPFENAPCVLLCHGLASNKDSEKWLTSACNLEDEGFAALRFNFRGCGWGGEWSEGDFQDTTLTARIKDYKAALDFLVGTGRVDTSRLGVIGSSLGGCTIIAANDPRPRTYAALATPYEFVTTPVVLKSLQEKGYYENLKAGEPRTSRIKKTLYDDLKLYDMGEAVRKIRHPLLIIHGSEDAIPVSDARRLYENANEPKRLEIIEGGSHTFVDTGHLGKVIDLSIEWFKKYL
jgi:dipeptidyl aminopeptidase/acylaminoacyl peptidase